MSAVKTVTDETFRAEVLRNPKPVLVEFWATWCPPCKQLAPVLDAIAAEHGEEFDVAKVNTDENPQTHMEQHIMLVPTLNLYVGGEVVKQVVGARSKSALMREFAGHVEAARVG